MGPADLAASGPAPLWRLAAFFLALAAIIALPFVIWGAYFEALFGPEQLRDWFAAYRGSAWLVAICLLVSDLALPIPNTVVMASLGAIYGPLLGGIVATAGNGLSGVLGYALCRRFGRPLARWLLSAGELAAAETLFARSGGWMVALSRWLPVLPEAVACMAGLARMPRGTFVLALLCGSAPLGFAVAALGHAGADRPLLTMALCALLPLPIWWLARRAAL